MAALKPAQANVLNAPSPCINVCIMRGDYCEGCYRTLDEIALWGSSSDAYKRAVWQKLDTRRLQQSKAVQSKPI